MHVRPVCVGRWAGRWKCRSGAEALFSAAAVSKLGRIRSSRCLRWRHPPSGSVLCGALGGAQPWSQALTLCLESLLISVDDNEDGGV